MNLLKQEYNELLTNTNNYNAIVVYHQCGRPYTEGKCNECGKKIGGSRHEAFEGNKRHAGQVPTYFQ